MPLPLGLELRDRLDQYLDRRWSLDEFKHWLIGATWDVEASGDRAAIALTYEINLALAERSGGNITEDEVRRELAPLRTATPTASTEA